MGSRMNYSSRDDEVQRRRTTAEITKTGDAAAAARYFLAENDKYIAHHGTTGTFLSKDERAMVEAVVAKAVAKEL